MCSVLYVTPFAFPFPCRRAHVTRDRLFLSFPISRVPGHIPLLPQVPRLTSHISRLTSRACFVLATVALLLLITACDGRPPAETTLYVATAANLATAMPELVQAFRKETGITVTPVVGSSGQLSQQIANGAPYDVFLSADVAHVDELIGKGYLIAESRRLYAQGQIVIVVNRESGLSISSLQDLTRPSVTRLAIANPTFAPYGQAARQALQNATVWAQVEDRVVLGENVRQALQFVQTGNAAVGIVARSIAHVPEVTSVPIPDNLYTPIHQAAAITTRTPYRQAAERFLAFMTGPTAQAILTRYGFSFPAEERP